MEREYASLLRDSEFKNQLYLFLLQNRENAVHRGRARTRFMQDTLGTEGFIAAYNEKLSNVLAPDNYCKQCRREANRLRRKAGARSSICSESGPVFPSLSNSYIHGKNVRLSVS